MFRSTCLRSQQKRMLSTILNTQKTVTKRVLQQPYNRKTIHGGLYLRSQASPAVAQRKTPTLGFGANDNTKIINPMKSDSGDVLSIKVTQRAAQKLNDIKKSDNNDDQVLRISVESGGCHGYQYILDLKSESTIDLNEDSVFERDGAKFVVDETSLGILRDSTVDYTTELIGSQFKVVNSPYASSSCGCGSSFDFDPSAIPK